MKTKRFLGVLLTLAMIIGLLPITASAADNITVTIDTGASITLQDADSDGYYDIGTADELYVFAATVNGGNTSINGELTASITVNEDVLTEDGNLNGDGSDFRVWTPIGNENSMYVGSFDGNEHTILGLYFNNNSASYVGLFGYVGESGKVQNVGVECSYLQGNEHIGGVVGINYGMIINCRNAGTINGIEYTGGVVGRNYGMIMNCYNTGSVIGDDSTGGVAGFNYDGTVLGYNSNGIITNCYNTGSVIATGTITFYTGGVAGQNCYGTITNCYNTGAVSGTYKHIGGVVGYNYYSGIINNCYYLEGCSGVGIGTDDSSDDPVISEVTEAQVKAASGEDGSLVDMLNEWVAQQNDEKYKGWHLCSIASSHYPSLNIENTYSYNGDNHIVKCTLCGYETTEAHTYIYTANENAINENCKQCSNSASIHLVLPDSPVYNGNAHKASYTGSFVNPDATVLIQYLQSDEDSETGYEALDSAPVDAGTYIVRLIVGEVYADRIMTIAPKEITLIGAEVKYKDYDGTPYVEIDPYYGYSGFEAEGVSDYDSIEILCTSAELESANAGTYDKVTVKGLTITGDDAHNYTVVSEATLPVYNIWGNSESSVTVYEKNLSIKLFDQEAGSLDAIDQSKWEIDEYYGLLEGHRIDSVKLIAEMNEGSTKYGTISVEEGSVRIVDADGNDVTANYGVSTNSATLTLTCPDHDEFEHGFCKNCGGYEKAAYNENEGYYKIENAGQLFWFAEYIANVSNEANAKLTDDITIPEGKEWTPIYNLYGTFDGNYKTISGLNVSESDSNYVGFIGYVGYYANVCNLHIADSNFVDADATYVGAIVGYHGGGEITNCYTDENVNVETGGVCGALVGCTYGTVRNCYAHGVLAGNGHYGTFENCYYIGEDDEIDGTTAVTAEQLANGEVAYLLQSGVLGEEYYDEDLQEWVTAEPEQVWGQDLSQENSLPVLGGAKVYQVLNCKEENAYSNTNENIGHQDEDDDAVCDTCGIIKNYKITNYNTLVVEFVFPEEDDDIIVVFADYKAWDDPTFVGLKYVPVKTTKTQGENVMSVPVPNGIEPFAGDKIMIWENFNTIRPLCEAYEVTGRETPVKDTNEGIDLPIDYN